MFQSYVLGFAFSEDEQRVALIEKKRPAWQAGRVNGIGGKVEPNEAPVHAMVREFFEETGVATVPLDWQRMASLQSPDYVVHVFKANLDIEKCQTVEDELIFTDWVEMIQWYDDDDILPNLRWLIPFCLNHGKTDSTGPVTMTFAA